MEKKTKQVETTSLSTVLEKISKEMAMGKNTEITIFYYVGYETNPIRVVSLTMSPEAPPPKLSFEEESTILGVTEKQWLEIGDSDEPSKILCQILAVPYQKWFDRKGHINVVEIAADESAWDLPCRFAHRVEQHARYCHNNRWVDAPRKCHRTVDGSNNVHGWPVGEHCFVDCPGFQKNPTYSEEDQKNS